MAEENVTTTETVVEQETPEQWLEKQPADIKAKFAAATLNLKGALDKERTAAGEGKKAQTRLVELEAAEQKRLEAQLTKEQLLEKQNAEYKAQAETATQKASEKLLKAAVLLKASALGFEHPADAFSLARAENALSTLSANDEGDFDEKAVSRHDQTARYSAVSVGHKTSLPSGHPCRPGAPPSCRDISRGRMYSSSQSSCLSQTETAREYRR